MESSKIKFAFITWAGVAPCAISNGAFRALVLQPQLGETIARMISCFMLISILMLVSYYFLTRTRLRFTDRELLVLGMVWLALTLTFEFGWGHYIEGKSWDVLLIDYDILKGRLWILVLAFTLFSPSIVGRSLRKTGRTSGMGSSVS